MHWIWSVIYQDFGEMNNSTLPTTYPNRQRGLKGALRGN